MIRTAHHFSMHQSTIYGAIGALPLPGAGLGLVEERLQFAQLGVVRPTGWMRRQLEAQRWGFVGNEYGLSRHAGNYSAASAWIDGDVMGGCGCFMAETYAYWLNGAIPLVTLLNDTTVLRTQLHTQVRTITARAARPLI